MSLVRATVYAQIFVLLCASLLAAGTAANPGASIPVPNGTWTMVLTTDFPVGTNDWEQLVYVPPLQRSVMLSMYHQNNSEPNESIIGYNFDTNAWDVLDMGGVFRTENMPEGGESQGYFDFNPNDNAIEYHCCTSGSNQAENVNHTWWFDVLGQSGRDKQGPLEPPPIALQPTVRRRARRFRNVRRRVFCGNVALQPGEQFVAVGESRRNAARSLGHSGRFGLQHEGAAGFPVRREKWKRQLLAGSLLLRRAIEYVDDGEPRGWIQTPGSLLHELRLRFDE